MNYKVTKIGLINFWYFDDEELSFSDGKLLLRGENGSGKSVTMQSFIPLILDGNKTPSRLDPFGSKEKRIEDYLLGPSDGAQKDDATGYLYMEVYQEEKNKYITIGMGLRARKGQATDFWGFALKDGKRIGEDFILYKDYGHKLLLTKKELRARLGNENEYTESTKEYKKMVNNLLFGFKELDSYDEFINVLLQLRSSKLSKDYTPTKLMKILSSVLQPLTEDDIRPISEAIEDTNKMRERVETLERQLKSLSNLLITYQNYNEIILYHKAQSVLGQKQEISRQEATIAENEAKILETQNRLESIGLEIEQLEREYSGNIVRLETIGDKDLEQKAEDLDSVEGEIRTETQNHHFIQEQLEKLFEKEKEFRIRIKKCDDVLANLDRQLKEICRDILEISDEVKLIDVHSAIGKVSMGEEANFDYLEERVSNYKKRLNQVKIKLEEKEELENHLNRLEEELQKKRKECEKEEKELQAEERKQQEYLDNLKDEIHLLDRDNEYVHLDQEIKKHIFSFLAEYNAENYRKSKEEYQRYAKSYELEAREEKNKIGNKLSDEVKARDLLKIELEELQNKTELELEENEEVIAKLNSFHIPYTSFYKAVEFKEHIKEEEKNKLEELLLSLNILNAKIVSKKDFKRVASVNTVFLKAGTKKTNNLLKYFQASSENVIPKQEIIDLLASISVDFKDASYINSAGYQLDFIVGYPGDTYQSKYIGILKRIEEQKRQINEKEKEIRTKEAMIHNLHTLLDQTEKKIEQICFEATKFPGNQELEKIYGNIQKLEGTLEILRKQNDEQEEKIIYVNKQIALKIQEIRDQKENIMIPLNLASYKEALEFVDQLRGNLLELKSVTNEALSMQSQLLFSQESLSDIQNDIDYKNAELNEKSRLLEQLISKEKAIRAVVENPDNQKLLEELKQIANRQKEIPKVKENLYEDRGKCRITLEECKGKMSEEQDRLCQSKLKLELVQSIFDQEYHLHYVYQVDSYEAEKIVVDLKERKNSDIQRALTNYLESYNDYRLDLAEYHLNTKEIFDTDEEIIESYIRRGLNSEFVCSLAGSAIRQDMTSNYQGKKIDIYQLSECLKAAVIDSQSYISIQERRLFEDILLKTVGNKIRDKIESSKKWVSKMNEIMETTQIDSNLSFQLEWRSKVAFTEDELDTKELVRLFKIDAGQLLPKDSEKLIAHFQSRIKKELEYGEKTHRSYVDIISQVLDYRNWFEFKLFYKRRSGERRELTDKVFYVLSGGERAKSMYVPLFASVYAKLLTARENSLRLIALDEAFAGVDNTNVREMFAILSQLNLDYILTSQALWGDYDSIKSLAICELIKDEANKAVGVRHYHWNGHRIEILENGRSVNQNEEYGYES